MDNSWRASLAHDSQQQQQQFQQQQEPPATPTQSQQSRQSQPIVQQPSQQGQQQSGSNQQLQQRTGQPGSLQQEQLQQQQKQQQQEEQSMLLQTQQHPAIPGPSTGAAAGNVDERELVWTKLQLLKDKYLQDLNELYGMLSNRSTQPMPAEQLRKLKHDKEILHRMIPYLRVPKGRLPKEFKKVDAFEKQLVNIMETFKHWRQPQPAAPGGPAAPGQPPPAPQAPAQPAPVQQADQVNMAQAPQQAPAQMEQQQQQQSQQHERPATPPQSQQSQQSQPVVQQPSQRGEQQSGSNQEFQQLTGQPDDGNAGSVEMLDLHLKLAQECLESVQKMSSRNFNNEQCDYLVDKLKVVVQSSSSFLKVSREGNHRSCSSVNIVRHIEAFKRLVTLANQVESFVQGCCKDAWIQAAMTLTNVSEHVASVGFNLELYRVVFCKEGAANERLSLDQVVDINKAEVGIVIKKASVDVDTLFDKVILEMPSLGSESKDLAIYLLQRLRSLKPIPVPHLPGSSSWDINDLGSYFMKLFTRVQQTARLGTCASGATVDRAMWLGTPVAMKTFYGPEDPEFMKEVEILGGLCHPNITTMFCSAMDRRRCSIVMELMDEDLHALMQRKLDENGDSPPFTIAEAIDIMLQIGEGVKYLHGKGIEHRDLKSFNILVKSIKARESNIACLYAKVTDFGLSKIKESSVTYSNRTFNTGTNRWMAPEIIKLNQVGSQVQGSGKVPKFSFKSDIYSFAMVCYEILTGELPFSTTRNPKG